MKNLWLHWLWQGLGMTYIAIIFYFCLIDMPPGPSLFPHFDKVLHFTIYLMLSVWFAQIYLPVLKIKLFLVFFLMSLTIETQQQLLTATRTFEWGDLAANITGLLVGFYLSWNFFPELLSEIDRRIKSLISH
ncbi:MAG: VanZ family protein [Pseudomonadota bacterium]